MNKLIRAALIGYGRWGRIIFPILKKLEKNRKRQFVLTALCDHHLHLGSSSEIRDCYIKIYTDITNMINQEKGLNTVFLATQPQTHYDLVKKCLDYRLNVFVEKSFVFQPGKARELVDLAEKNHCVLMTGHRLLYSPAIIFVKKNIALHHSTTDFYIEALWKQWGINQSCGVHWDLACHYIAVINYLTNVKPQLIQAYCLGKDKNGWPEEVKIILKYHSFGWAFIGVSWKEPVKEKKLTIKTARDIIIINNNFNSLNPVQWFTVSENRINLKSIGYSDTEDHTIEDQFINFLDAIHNPGTPVIASGEQAINVVRILSEIEKQLNGN